MSRAPLAVTRRGGRIEATHYGSIVITDPNGGILFSIGDADLPTYVRSSNKMIQALPVVRSGAADKYGFTQQELAVCCASHSAAHYHLDTVRSILEKIGLDVSDLGCGAHDPSDPSAFKRLICSGEQPTAIHNNCSGKHAGMLAATLAMGWPIENYLEWDHPLQQWIFDLMVEHSGVPREQIGTATDGCSLPTFYLPLSSIATCLARFMANAEAGDEASRRIVNAMAAFPEMIYEHGGFDSELIRALRGRGIAKRGAMAVFVVGLLSQRFGPIGMAVKLEDGNISQMPVVVMSALEQLELITPEEATHLADFRRIIIRNWNEMEVGDIAAQFTLTAAARVSVA